MQESSWLVELAPRRRRILHQIGREVRECLSREHFLYNHARQKALAIQIGEWTTVQRPSRPNPIEEAERLDQAFRDSGLPTLAAFADRMGVTRARLSQVFALLRLPESVKESVRRLGPVVHRASISERELRPITTLPTAPAQLRAFRVLLRRKRLKW